MQSVSISNILEFGKLYAKDPDISVKINILRVYILPWFLVGAKLFSVTRSHF